MITDDNLFVKKSYNLNMENLVSFVLILCSMGLFGIGCWEIDLTSKNSNDLNSFNKLLWGFILFKGIVNMLDIYYIFMKKNDSSNKNFIYILILELLCSFPMLIYYYKYYNYIDKLFTLFITIETTVIIIEIMFFSSLLFGYIDIKFRTYNKDTYIIKEPLLNINDV